MIYLINRFNKHCPEYDNCQYIVAAYHKLEDAEAFIARYKELDTGLAIIPMETNTRYRQLEYELLDAKFREVMEDSDFDNERDSYYMSMNEYYMAKIIIVSNKFKDLSNSERLALCSKALEPVINHDYFIHNNYIIDCRTREEYEAKQKLLNENVYHGE